MYAWLAELSQNRGLLSVGRTGHLLLQLTNGQQKKCYTADSNNRWLVPAGKPLSAANNCPGTSIQYTIAYSLTRRACSISHRALDSTAIRNGNGVAVSYPCVLGDTCCFLGWCSLSEGQDKVAARPIVGSTNVRA